jgi:hypothetical protein
MSLPGQELVEQGLADLSQDRSTEAALLVLIAAPRLKRLGIEVPERPLTQSSTGLAVGGVRRPAPSFEHQLYEMIEDRLGSAAHSYYNSLLRRIVSYARAREREMNARRQERPMRRVDKGLRSQGRAAKSKNGHS